ncbi:hypothetical protein AHAS_Ahas10G0154500 [Arachis hypogaea]
MRTHLALTVKEAAQFFREECDVNVNEIMIYRCIVKARERIEGSEKAQYSLLRDYGDEILRYNPGSTVIIETTPMPDSDNLFKRIYICLDACKKGFLGGYRPFICLDGMFLKGYYGGQLLAAIGQDVNNHIYPIAYAIVTAETKDSWKWVVFLLCRKLCQNHIIDFVLGIYGRILLKNGMVLTSKEHCSAVQKVMTPQEFDAAMDRVKRMKPSRM